MKLIEKILNFITEPLFKKNEEKMEIFVTNNDNKPFKKIPKIHIKK